MKDDIVATNDTAILDELRSINRVLSDSNTPIKYQELLYFLLQFFGILAATVFGVFSILAWTAANKSNAISTRALEVALQNNGLALLAYCYDLDNNYFEPGVGVICNHLLKNGTELFAPIVASVDPGVPTGTHTNSATTTSSDILSTSVPPPTSVLVSSVSSVSSVATSFSTSSSIATSSSISISSTQSNTLTLATTSTPTSTRVASPTPASTSNSKSTDTGAIAGGVVGAVAAGVAVFSLVLWLRYKTYQEKLRRSQTHALEKAPGAI